MPGTYRLLAIHSEVNYAGFQAEAWEPPRMSTLIGI